MPDDIVVNKATVIERCVARVREEYADDPGNLYNDIRRQDSIILNMLRASEASIDLAMHLIRRHRLGIPQESRDAFEMLATSGLLESQLADRMMAMVGFRNVAVHEYQRLNLDIVKAIVENDLDDFLSFSTWALKTQAATATQDQ